MGRREGRICSNWKEGRREGGKEEFVATGRMEGREGGRKEIVKLLRCYSLFI